MVLRELDGEVAQRLAKFFLARDFTRVPELAPDLVILLEERDVMAALARYPWPGNVRELENLIERIVVIGTQGEVSMTELAELAPKIASGTERFSLPRDRLATLREVEDEYIEWMIEQCGGNKTRAAERLGIDKATLHRRAKRTRE